MGYSVKMAPTNLTEEKQNLYQTCLFQISQIHKSLKLVGICVFFASKYMYWCMFTYLDIAWNYKVTKINQIINQNRWTPSIRHQSGLNPLLVFSMPMDVFPLLISLQRNMHPHFVSCCWDNANGQINLYHRDSIKDLLILVLNPVGWFLPSFILKFSKNGTSQPSILYLKVNLIFSTTHQTRVSCTFRCKKNYVLFIHSNIFFFHFDSFLIRLEFQI